MSETKPVMKFCTRCICFAAHVNDECCRCEYEKSLKPKKEVDGLKPDLIIYDDVQPEAPKVKKGRGRTKGSKNKVKGSK